MHDAVAANKRRIRLLLAVVGGAVIVVAGIVLSVTGLGWIGLLVGLFLGAGVVAVAVRGADVFVLGRCGARPVDDHDEPRLHNLVDGLCVASGLPKPALYVIDDDAPNAFAVGRDASHASIVVTAGLLAELSRVELEGVLAHELVHVANLDIAPSTLLAAIGSLVPPVARLALDPSIDIRRETAADVRGVQITRYPPGLVAALEKLRDDERVVRSSRANAHLWIEPPVAGGERRLDERIALLREL